MYASLTHKDVMRLMGLVRDANVKTAEALSELSEIASETAHESEGVSAVAGATRPLNHDIPRRQTYNLPQPRPLASSSHNSEFMKPSRMQLGRHGMKSRRHR